MPDEHTGSVKENYQWKVTTHTHTHTRVHEVVPSLTWRTIGKHFEHNNYIRQPRHAHTQHDRLIAFVRMCVRMNIIISIS